MKDYIVKAIAHNNQVRAYAAITTETVGEAERRHHTLPTASAALGRSMTVGVILGAMLKGEEKISIKINGGGPIGTILVDANTKGEVRGYVTSPQTHFDLNEHDKLDVKRAVGTNGVLTISKDIGLQHPFVGSVPIVSGEIGDDFTSYFAISEQVPSSVGVGVLVNTDQTIQAAGGFVIQLMPGTDDDTIHMIEERLKDIMPLSSMVEQGMTPEQILEQVLGAEDVKFLEKVPVQFQCQCSEERISNAIISLGSAEILDMIQTDGQAEVNCHFCNENYHYSKQDLELLLEVVV